MTDGLWVGESSKGIETDGQAETDHGNFSLAVPFTEVFFGLAVPADEMAARGDGGKKGPVTVGEYLGVLFTTGDAA